MTRVESFVGVANHWLLGRIEPGSVVLDLGCGAGTDLLIAAQMTGTGGRAIGVDMTPAMLGRAAAGASEMGLGNVALHEALIEALPVADASEQSRPLVLETFGLTKRFGERVVVDDVTIAVPRAGAFGFLGHNGA